VGGWVQFFLATPEKYILGATAGHTL